MDQSEIDALLAGGGKPPKKPKAAAKAPVAEPVPAPSAASVQTEPHKDGSGHVISELDTVTSVTERESNKVMDQLDQISQLVARQQQLVTDMMRHEGAQSPGAQKAIHEVMSASKEIQDKVFEAMDLMQFQDITRQKLERIVHHLRQIHDYIIRLDPQSQKGKAKNVTMESCHGGYGKGYTMANMEFDKFLKACDVLSVQFGVNIILTAHVFSAKIMDPTSGEYDCWDLLLHSPKNNKTYGKREMITQWADVIGFLYEPIFVSAAEGKSNLSRGMSQNKGRVLGVSRTPAYIAGNRYGMTGEIPIPGPPANGWNYFAEGLYKTCGIDVYTR